MEHGEWIEIKWSIRQNQSEVKCAYRCIDSNLNRIMYISGPSQRPWKKYYICEYVKLGNMGLPSFLVVRI